RECARAAAAPATGSGSATRTRRVRNSSTAQQLAQETDHADPPCHHWSRATRAGTVVCVCPADDCGPGQSLHAGGFCREICNDTGKKRDPSIASAGQAGDAKEGRKALLRLCRCCRLQLCLCWDARSLFSLSQLGEYWSRRQWRTFECHA